MNHSAKKYAISRCHSLAVAQLMEIEKKDVALLTLHTSKTSLSCKDMQNAIISGDFKLLNLTATNKEKNVNHMDIHTLFKFPGHEAEVKKYLKTVEAPLEKTLIYRFNDITKPTGARYVCVRLNFQSSYDQAVALSNKLYEAADKIMLGNNEEVLAAIASFEV
jgi:hypothetical protein